MPSFDPFEDILDGYFPLRLSIADLMRRNGLTTADLHLTFAPILAIEGLPPETPVPLNIRSGRAGMIEDLILSVRIEGADVHLSGSACWHWLDGTPVGTTLDPMTRLAEPALVSLRVSDSHCVTGAEIRTDSSIAATGT
ncbi:MAG: hypothetical protein P1U53_04865 [Sulfitobacter sp.]|nr:hypothetical protein [Sulfitobacter sp.]